MGFYIRKSIHLGPLRFNLSKSGIGVSTGIKGFRIGAGPRGNYVHLGVGGLYYRKTLSSNPVSPPRISSEQLSETTTISPMMEDIESGSVEEMVDSSATELLEELNLKRNKWDVWKFISAMALLASYASKFSPWVVVVSVVSVSLAYWYDQFRKNTILFYDFEPNAEALYSDLNESFDRMRSCNRIWHVEAKGQVSDPKYHSGASSFIKRNAITLSKGAPSLVKTNIDVPVLPAGRQTLYFFPERILVYDGDKVGAVSYSNLELSTCAIHFAEEELIPKDSHIIDRTWRYTNKAGGPDKRFKDNKEIPIVLYERLMLSSPTGLKEFYDLSAVNVSKDFIEAIRNIASIQDASV